MRNVIEVVVAEKNLATLLKSFKSVQLENELSKKGPYTVFAPSDLAFGKLPAGALAELMKPENKVQLTDMLSNHIVLGKNNYEDLVNGQTLKAISGRPLSVTVKAGTVSIDGSKIENKDLHASNGVVHSVDKVIEQK